MFEQKLFSFSFLELGEGTMYEIKSVITTSHSKIVTLMTFFHTLTAFLTQSKSALVLPEYRQLMVEDMKKSDQEKYRN